MVILDIMIDFSFYSFLLILFDCIANNMYDCIIINEKAARHYRKVVQS